jgi:hypothetical protein
MSGAEDIAGSSSASRGVPNSLKKAPMTIFSLCWRDRFSRKEMSRSMMRPTMSTSIGRKAMSNTR